MIGFSGVCVYWLVSNGVDKNYVSIQNHMTSNVSLQLLAEPLQLILFPT